MTHRLRLMAVAVLMLASSALAEEKYALLVGVDGPRVGVKNLDKLRYPSKDVDDLHAVLLKNGYKIVPIKTEQALRRDILMKLYDLADRIQPEDSFILYYSGHGMRNPRNKKTYWVTWEIDPYLVDIDGIRLEHLIEFVLDVPAKRKLVLLDHCFGGDIDMDILPPVVAAAPPAAPPTAPAAAPPPTRATSARGRAAGQGPAVRKTAVPLEEIEDQVKPDPEASGIIVLAASRDEALEADKLQHGVFTSALLRAFESRDADTADPKGKLTVGELIDYLQKRVPDLAKEVSGTMQRPKDFIRGSELRSWVLSDLPLQGSEAADRAIAYKQTLRAWETAEWLSYNNRLTCFEVIDKWLTATSAGTELGGFEGRLFRHIQNAIDNRQAVEERRAKTLEEDITNEPR